MTNWLAGTRSPTDQVCIIGLAGAKNKYELELAGVREKYRKWRRGSARNKLPLASACRERGYRNKWCYRQNEMKALVRALFMPATTHRARRKGRERGSAWRRWGHQIHCYNLCLITLSGPMNSSPVGRFVLISRFYRFARRMLRSPR